MGFSFYRSLSYMASFLLFKWLQRPLSPLFYTDGRAWTKLKPEGHIVNFSTSVLLSNASSKCTSFCHLDITMHDITVFQWEVVRFFGGGKQSLYTIWLTNAQPADKMSWKWPTKIYTRYNKVNITAKQTKIIRT